MFFSFSTFIAVNAEGLKQINQLEIWVFAMVALLLVSIFGTYRIWTWIKEGKL